ncbi:MAG: hypothetical protein AUG06_11935 [Actinobacteria bacterium 13_1_20CM_2_65_11]|nr:MAG: hypothetical protein AUH69_06000 [Actinobacteria bacterium 13_1_40CM_4_65_12]OLE78094.1 MAG: hypothetical protein AUG06_11935 [Actinobacteria bacterium 13_1_20CM_2_65_11]
MREDTMELVKTYYDSWRNGIASFDATRVGGILAEDLDFEGPIAGKRRGAVGFIGGLTRFVEGLQAPISVLQQVESDDQAAAIYDAQLPGGTMRFAEFFQVEDGRIQAIKLVYDAAQYRAFGGR